MKKAIKNVLVVLLSVVFAVSFVTGCATQNSADRQPDVTVEKPGASNEKPNVVVPGKPVNPAEGETAETTQEDSVKDKYGNLLKPFDMAYPEAFESGRYPYDKSTVLLKLDGADSVSAFSLSSCGIAGIEAFTSTAQGSWYRATLKAGSDIHKTMSEVRELDGVIAADYDYIYETEAETVSADSETPEADGLIDEVLGNLEVTNQWYLTSSAIQRAWRYLQSNGIPAGGSSSVVVAVIDTGVDYTHPDLAANMWVNTAEIPDNGIDDDGNGYVDDIYGANTIADNGGADGNEGDPMDDHGHGTHVAGIIGAANNREGIVGVAYNAKIMAVKAGQSTGVFNQSDIAEAILYAYEMGADVINMSFGGSAISLAVQEALETAYTRSTLVASAGNDGAPNETADYYDPLPNYPAALSYVVGVMSVGALGIESAFTNWDAAAFNSYEYEVYAPGEAILSTLPGGGYGMLSGTSMAAPVVSGAAALLRSYFTDRDMYPSRYIAAQLSATSGDTATCVNPLKHTVGGMLHNLPMRLNVYDALTKVPTPDVALYDWYMFDSESLAEGNNGDGVADAGETIDISPVLRNRWGMSEDTIITIDTESGLGGSNPYVELLTSSVNYGSVGTYSTKDELIYNESGVVTGAENTLKIKIADNCPNDYLIQLNVTITCGNALDSGDRNTYTTYGTIQFWVRNGVVLTRQITEDEMWTKDNYYIIPSSLYIAEGATVTVEPGTQIQFWSNDPEDPYTQTSPAKILVAGSFITCGSQEELVEIFPGETHSAAAVVLQTEAEGYIELKYVQIKNARLYDVQKIDHCKLNGDSDIENASISNSYFSNSGVGFTDCVLTKCFLTDCKMGISNSAIFHECVFIHSSKNSSHIPVKQAERVEVKDYYYDEINNVVYMILRSNIYGTYSSDIFKSYGAMYYAEELANLLNGTVACAETQEEWEILKNLSLSVDGFGAMVGLRSGENRWVNGQLIGDFIMQDILNKPNDVGYLNVDGNNICQFGASDYAIIEIPVPDLDVINLDSLSELVNTKIESNDGINWQFKDNILLNNFNETNIGNWLQVRAGGRNTSKKYDKINISENWWGTLDQQMINAAIYDFDDNVAYSDVIESPFDTTPPEDTFPFVTDAYLLNSDGERVRTVGNETVTFVVEFNRDMDTTQPLRVRFGAAEPYAEYEVEGEFVNARRWEGTYTLKTTIENGNQIINIENGRAADDHWLILCESAGRFQFEIDTTAAQAMIMQANPTETGIQLTWQQDDYDTLMGYNVYRSDSEDGFYQRLNDYVLPVGEEQFFDDTVEPGKQYFYNFTVVQTDLSESTPSGKISVWSLDTMAPDIYHSPVRTAYTGSNLVVSATITDNLRITEAKVWYRAVGGEWKSVTMTAFNSRYSAIIPAADISLEGLEYYIAAFDGLNYTYEGSEEAPFSVTVKQAVDKNSLGDVDGDGTITTKDALMLLQAANDLLNLSEEQFLRADINGDKVLSAAEALRILQYVSGKVTTIIG